MSDDQNIQLLAKEANDIHALANIISTRISKPKRCKLCVMQRFFEKPENNCLSKNDKECLAYIQKYLNEITQNEIEQKVKEQEQQ